MGIWTRGAPLGAGAGGDVGAEPAFQSRFLDALSLVDVPDGHDDDLELQVHDLDSFHFNGGAG